MLKIKMSRCYPHMDNSSVLNGIITDVERHYNNMVEVISRLEKTSGRLYDRITKIEKMSEATSVKLDCNKFKEKMGGLENDLLNAAEDNDFGKQMETVRQISHHIRVEEFYKQIAELKEANKILWEENRKLKGVHPV